MPCNRLPSLVALASLFCLSSLAPLAPRGLLAAQSDERPSGGGFWKRWLERSERAKAEQPSWITPIATTTPRLEQEYRFDVNWSQARPGAPYAENIGNTKGLELIPVDRVEIIAGVPGYVLHNNPAVPDGWGDFSLLVKYRMLAAPAAQGNYILSAFLASTFPTATNNNGQAKAIVTPTLAYGKGWGAFDMQGTVASAIPTGDASIIGRTYTWNHAFQFHVLQKLWPEVEMNRTWFVDGKNDGREQTFVTPGLVVGRLPLSDHTGFTFGFGVQMAVSTFHTSNHTIILSTRLPF